MNIKKLAQYNYLILEIDSLKDSIDYYNQVLERLNKRYIRCNNELKEIQSFIDDVDDDRIEKIIYMKYFENRSWLDISLFFGSSEESYARNLINRYLKEYNDKQQ